jgi:excinuclease ABC subunit A
VSEHLADFYQLSIRDALAFVGELAAESASGILHDALPQNSFAATANGLVHPDRNRTAHRSADILSASPIRIAPTESLLSSRDPLTLALNEVRSRLAYLDEVGLGYLTLDRPTRSLSGGETERVNLTTCLGTRLVNTLFVLDEPSVGLHPRDTDRLVRILKMLRDTGNTVVVVEHEPAVMRAADHIVDLGPGHGESGGQVVFQGSFENISRARESLTGQYLSRRKEDRSSRSARRYCGYS